MPIEPSLTAQSRGLKDGRAMEGVGGSIWVVLILIALLFVVFWGAIFFFFAFATWFIARSRVPGDNKQPRDPNDWDSSR
ncbi:MAG: hypothetical protein GEU73_04405 [Chloroflexi bacterium]|nr:hypothetical protein [Chloroflexota bacterium]